MSVRKLRLAPAALTAGDQDKARSFATELIALGESQRNKIPAFGPSLYSDARHIGNMILGQQAFAAGDLTNVKTYLLAAADVPGSPVLNSFGPNMQQPIQKHVNPFRHIILYGS